MLAHETPPYRLVKEMVPKTTNREGTDPRLDPIASVPDRWVNKEWFDIEGIPPPKHYREILVLETPSTYHKILENHAPIPLRYLKLT